jgi:hypothetical protein
LTVRLTVVVCDRLPLVPLIVSVNVPRGVLDFVETVIVELPEPVMEPGLNDAVARDGNPLTLRLTLPLNPLLGVTVTVYVVEFPRFTERVAGDAEIEKLGGFAEFTVSVTLVVWVKLPDVP